MPHDTTTLFSQTTFEAPTVSQDRFREAMSLLGAPVVLVTTDGLFHKTYRKNTDLVHSTICAAKPIYCNFPM